MRMKGRIFVALCLVCALSSMVVFGVYAQVSGGLGVKAGDNFTYSFDVSWSSTNPSKVVPSEFSDLNQTRSIHINVTEVGPTIAYVNITKIVTGGSPTVEAGYIEVQSGRGTDNVQLIIIGANLTSGQEAYPLAEGPASAESFTITETVAMTYLGALRDVNHYHASETLTDGSVVRDAYYDKATGILLEMTLQHSFAVNVDEIDTDSEHWKITQFNEAAAPADGTDDGTNGTGSTSTLPEWVLYAAIAAVVVVAATLLAVVMLRRRKKPEVQAPPPAPVQPPNPV